jgi:CRISPR-associated exonuclease, Cas4 family
VIKEAIIKAYRKMQEQHPPKDEKTIYVTDLLHCVIRPRTETSPIALIRGTALHEGIERLLKNYGEIEIEFEKEVRKQYGEYTLIGKLDGLTKDNIVIEFKSVYKPPTFPYEPHIYQVLIYMKMIGSEKGLLVYIGNNDIAEFEITKESIRNIETGQTFFGKYKINDEWIYRQIVAYMTKTLIAVFDECKFCEINKSCKYTKIR